MAPAAASIPADQPGPHPSFIHVAKPFLFEQKITSQIILTGTNPAREDSFRLQGIQWIDEVRSVMQLPVRTFNTAAVYYHKFRLIHKDTDYQYIDAAAAALFTACKIEDTLKKSREILCAAYNIKVAPAEHLTPDDQVFDGPSKTIIGLERLMLEASGFDYRARYPQKLLFKLASTCALSPPVTKTAYKMLLDLYRTFAPLKATSATMAFACLELTTRLMNTEQGALRGESAPRHQKWKTSRQQIMEAMLDLLDLYTHFPKSSILGQKHSIETFIEIRITLNREAEERRLPRYADLRDRPANGLKNAIKTPKTPITPASPTDVRPNGAANAASPTTLSPRSSGSGKKGVGSRGYEGTVRFMLDGARAKREKATVAEYFKTEFEEYEVEVDAEPEEAVATRAPSSANGAANAARSNGFEGRHKNARDERNGGGKWGGGGGGGGGGGYDRDYKRPRR